MIKIAVSGCDTVRAQELVRVLVNHPDVELKWVSGRGQAGSRLDEVVPALLGESELTVVAEGSLDDIDLVFLCGNRNEVASRLAATEIPDSVHVIDLSGGHNQDYSVDSPWKYGLSEMQRRFLVHDTRLVTVPGNAAAASLLALLPLARNMMANSPLTLHVELGRLALSGDDMTSDGMKLDEWARDQRREIEFALNQIQPGFSHPVELVVTAHAESRVMTVTASLKCDVASDVLRELYEQYYDDHNFVFIVNRPVTSADVVNTNKCLINIDKDDTTGMVTVRAVMDVLLKGAAGTAVHAMNLMFGLHERVGLALKGTGC